MSSPVRVMKDEPEHIRVAADCHVPFEPEKLPDQKKREPAVSLKKKLREKIKGLSINKADREKILAASYAECGNDGQEHFDLENRLFYNLRANSIFKEKAPKELIFQKAENADAQPFVYDYQCKEKSEIKTMLRKENRLAHWKDVPIEKSFPNKPERYYAALRRLTILSDSQKKADPNTVIRSETKPYAGAFGIQITLTVPYSTHPAAAMKPLLDGVICAFHGEDGTTKDRLKEKFGGRSQKLLEHAERWNVLGRRDYLQHHGKDKAGNNRFQWNPADEAARLQFGWIVVEQGKDDQHKMSGSIYRWD